MKVPNIEAVYALSPSQQGMLLETLSSPESGVHIEQSVLSLRGPLNPTVFKQAWQSVMARHSSLRSGFFWEGQEEPVQFVLQRVDIPFLQQDWRGLSSREQQEQLDAYLRRERRSGFKLAKVPLMRLSLFQTGNEAYHFVWTFHHILMDGWCLPIIMQEALAFYEAESHGQDLELKPSRPYKDYITWVKQQDLSQAEAFWRTRLQGFTRATPLGMKADLSGQEEGYSTQKAHLPASATAALHALVREHHLTLNALIQGTWALLLSRYSGESDVLFGATVSGRPPELEGVESMVGLFINTLPVRIKVSGQAKFLSWLQDIQAQNLAQQPYSYCSAGQIHQWSEVPGSLPLYESLLVFENYPVDSSLQPSETTFEVHYGRSIGAQTNYPLTVLVLPNSELGFHVVYDNSRFDASHINQLLTHLLTLLESVVATPKGKVATILTRIPVNEIKPVIPVQNAPSQPFQESFVPPRDPLEQQLAYIWQDVLGCPVGVQNNFFDLGGHSLIAVRLMARIQQQFGLNLPLAILFQSPTIEQMAPLLRQQPDSLPWSSLVPIQPNGGNPPFFCAPGAGGNVVYFYDLARLLGSEQPFYGLQAVGLDGESAPHTTIEEMATHYITAIQTVQPQGPYFLGGHSFGSWIAFEMAQQLLKAGHEVARVVILDTGAPTERTESELAAWDDARWLAFMAEIFGQAVGQESALSYEALQSHSPYEQLIRFKEELERMNFLPAGSDIKQARGWVQVFKANSLTTDYLPREVIPTRITLFRAEEGQNRSRFFEATEEDEQQQEPTWGWSEFAEGPVEVVYVPGDHVTMMPP